MEWMEEDTKEDMEAEETEDEEVEEEEIEEETEEEEMMARKRRKLAMTVVDEDMQLLSQQVCHFVSKHRNITVDILEQKVMEAAREALRSQSASFPPKKVLFGISTATAKVSKLFMKICGWRGYDGDMRFSMDNELRDGDSEAAEAIPIIGRMMAVKYPALFKAVLLHQRDDVQSAMQAMRKLLNLRKERHNLTRHHGIVVTMNASLFQGNPMQKTLRKLLHPGSYLYYSPMDNKSSLLKCYSRENLLDQFQIEIEQVDFDICNQQYAMGLFGRSLFQTALCVLDAEEYCFGSNVDKQIYSFADAIESLGLDNKLIWSIQQYFDGDNEMLILFLADHVDTVEDGMDFLTTQPMQVTAASLEKAFVSIGLLFSSDRKTKLELVEVPAFAKHKFVEKWGDDGAYRVLEWKL